MVDCCMDSKKILILTDPNYFLLTSVKSKNRQVNVKKIAFYLSKAGWTIHIKRYCDLDFSKPYYGYYILYASAEDYGLFYKDYIEDILLWFQSNGNILLPKFNHFRAHHNKMFMELLRTNFKDARLKTISSKYFASYSELKQFVNSANVIYPYIVKSSAGSGSCGVALAHNKKELLKFGRRYTRRFYFDFHADLLHTIPFQFLINQYRKRKGIPTKVYRRKNSKFIIQNFLPHMVNDYVVTILGDKYYVVKRNYSDKDFAAFWKDKLIFPDLYDDIKMVLDLAKLANEEIHQPMAIMDFVSDNKTCHLIEFQTVGIGAHAVELSDHYFVHEEDGWRTIQEKSDLEQEIANSISYFIKNTSSK